MQAALEHLQTHQTAYIVGLACALPLFILFRKYTLPALYHVLEFSIYVVCMHVLMGGIIRMFSWFREETAFKSALGEPLNGFVPMTTPISDGFWLKKNYSPEWLFYFELGLIAFIMYVVIVIRPVKLGNTNFYKGKEAAKKKAAKKKKSGRRGTPGSYSPARR